MPYSHKLLGSAGKIFDAKSGRPSAAEAKTAADVARFKDVIAEITAENLELKKRALGLEDHWQLPAALQREVHAIGNRE